MTKDEALAHVASHVASWVQGSTFAEATGIEDGDETVSEADRDRLGGAVDEVVGRLYRMGKGGRSL